MRILFWDSIWSVLRGPDTIADIKKDAREQSARDLHTAELNFERALADVKMHRDRDRRLNEEAGPLTIQGMPEAEIQRIIDGWVGPQVGQVVKLDQGDGGFVANPGGGRAYSRNSPHG